MANTLASRTTVIIQPGGDLTFGLSTTEKIIDGSGKSFVRTTNTGNYFLVSRQVMIDSSHHFKVLLDGPFKEGGQSVVQLEDEKLAAVELWLRCLHGVEFTAESFKVTSEEMYEIIQFSIKRGLETEKLNSWFATYWKTLDLDALDLDDFKQQLYPSMTFDHPWAFARTSRYLVFNGVGHIEEKNPTYYLGLRSTKGVINQINACKGSMRKEINKEIMKHLRSFKRPIPASASCKCRVFGRDNYVEALDATGVWPLDERNLSIKQILAGLAQFKYVAPTDACASCSKGIAFHVLIRNMRNYFDGLCLDCMDSSRPKTGSLDTDYWLHNQEMKWDASCRISHKRNTWYFSYMGRPEQMESHQREMKDRRDRRLREQAARERLDRERVARHMLQAKAERAQAEAERGKAETDAAGPGEETSNAGTAVTDSASTSIFGP